MKLSNCETITDQAKFISGHLGIIEGLEERIKQLHPESREAMVERIRILQQPYNDRLEKFNQLKK